MPVFLKDVKAELQQFGRSVRKGEYRKQFRVSERQLVKKANLRNRSITYKTVVAGETNNYTVYVQFFGIDFREEPNNANTWLSVDVDGKKWWYRAPSARKNPVHLKCSDPDFRFRFEKPLFDAGGLIGTFRKYKRKTPPPPVGRPYANPDDLLGFCKHIWSLLRWLQAKGLMTE